MISLRELCLKTVVESAAFFNESPMHHVENLRKYSYQIIRFAFMDFNVFFSRDSEEQSGENVVLFW
jgi:hypothetical protein